MGFTVLSSDAGNLEVHYVPAAYLTDVGVEGSDDPARRLVFLDTRNQHTHVLEGEASWIRRQVSRALVLVLQDGAVIPPDLMTTAEDFPQLWGITEIAAFADHLADQLGKPRYKEGRFWTWEQMTGFPQPVARLAGATVWLAADIIPYLADRMAADRLATTPLPDDVRAEILAENGKLSARATAVKYGVGESTVRRIWTKG